MNFDTLDIPGLGSAFEDVVLHEMAHVIGIGTMWSGIGFNPTATGYQELYVDGSGEYTGANAVAAWQSEFGQTDDHVPVELGGGAGTANGHWNEVDGGAALTGITSTQGDFRNELMTGWLNAPSFISGVTIGGMQDLGYFVAAVPEPSTAVPLIALALFATQRMRKRRR